MKLSRRGLLLTAAPALIGATAPGWTDVLSTRARALSGPGLLRSYDCFGSSSFDLAHGNCAYVYDNALAGLALLAVGAPDLAEKIGMALVQAQRSDRFFTDGRLRNAYAAGPTPIVGTYPLPGRWDATSARWLEDSYQVGTATGVLAWAGLLWTRLLCATGKPIYRQAANHAADWVIANTATANGFSGGVDGFEPAQTKLLWRSTEHNIDLAVLFAALGRAEAARAARDFVTGQFSTTEKRFLAGLRPDGTENALSAVDANLWPLLAADALPNWQPALDWILAENGIRSSSKNTLQGVDFNGTHAGIWLEGTAITALALRQAGRTALADSFMATLQAQTSASGLIYACDTPTLPTGLAVGPASVTADFLYFRRPALAPTAWAILAQAGSNPLRA